MFKEPLPKRRGSLFVAVQSAARFGMREKIDLYGIMVYHIDKGVRVLPKLNSAGDKQRVTFYADRDQYKDLKYLALEKGCPVSELLNKAIDECLKTKGEYK